jgi:large subunit ribosomal protein L25
MMQAVELDQVPAVSGACKERGVEQIELHVSSRKLMGKKSRFLRRQGITPVHLFGYDTEPMALQCETVQLKQVLRTAGKTKLVGLRVDKHKKPRNVVVREVQKNALSGELLHVDFFQVSLEEKIKVEVPVVLVGEAPALKVKTNTMAQDLAVVEVECLPDRIPESIRVDVSILVEDDQSVQVKDLVLGEGVVALSNPEQVVVRIAPLQIEKEEKKVVAEVVVAEGAEGAEAAVAAEGAPEEAKEAKEGKEPKKEDKK